MHSTKEILNVTLKEAKVVQVTVLCQCCYMAWNAMFDLSQLRFHSPKLCHTIFKILLLS